MDQEKRRHRQLKRDIKKAGNRQRRRSLARDLRDDPEGAAHSEFDFGHNSSTPFNGNDHDATRRRQDRETRSGTAGESDDEAPRGEEEARGCS
jgi:hypothetical protein